ncbi:hypothetical protein HMI55_003277 [Coelomomyces lativittatus]|nr:hypothetical protein HMI55_003277 [Coelomomyces lativittatus]
MVRLLPKLDWEALKSTVQQLNLPHTLPVTFPEDASTNSAFLIMLHHILLEYHITSGSLVCPECKHVYPIREGIPNMLLTDNETK